jgi:hypothetical protein
MRISAVSTESGDIERQARYDPSRRLASKNQDAIDRKTKGHCVRWPRGPFQNINPKVLFALTSVHPETWNFEVEKFFKNFD